MGYRQSNKAGDNVKYFTVPADVLMDVLYILFNNSIHHQIKSVNRNENSVLLHVSSEKQPAHFKNAIENIESILNSYSQYQIGIGHDWN